MSNKNGSEAVAKHFAQRADNYDSAGTWVKNEVVLNLMSDYLPTSMPECKVLDLGCGTGAVCGYIAEKFPSARNLTAVDNCTEMISKIESTRILKVLSSVESLPFCDDSFDCVVSRQCLHYVDKLECALSEVSRIIKTGGTFVLAQIVPYDDATKDYWTKIIEIHQPLRRHFFSALDWDKAVQSHGFQLVDSKRCTHRSSITKWIKKYDIDDIRRIDEMNDALRLASNEYKRSYEVEFSNDDITYLAFWYIAKYVKL